MKGPQSWTLALLWDGPVSSQGKVRSAGGISLQPQPPGLHWAGVDRCGCLGSSQMPETPNAQEWMVKDWAQELRTCHLRLWVSCQLHTNMWVKNKPVNGPGLGKVSDSHCYTHVLAKQRARRHKEPQVWFFPLATRPHPPPAPWGRHEDHSNSWLQIPIPGPLSDKDGIHTVLTSNLTALDLNLFLSVQNSNCACIASTKPQVQSLVPKTTATKPKTQNVNCKRTKCS